jgi:hypothetical protein
MNAIGLAPVLRAAGAIAFCTLRDDARGDNGVFDSVEVEHADAGDDCGLREKRATGKIL